LLYGERGSCAAPLAAEKRTEVVAWRKAASRRVVNLGHRFRSSSVFFRRSKQFPRRCADINCMTLPRPVFQGDTIHIQRRTRSGHYFLVPNEETLQLVRYAFAVAAARYGLILHAVCVMSNHLHVIATDPRGLHPDFTAYAHRLIALGLKKMHDIEENVWAQGGPPVQRLVGRHAIIEALAYVRINPVAAGCVHHEDVYPGLYGSKQSDPLGTLDSSVVRPHVFGRRSTLPELATFSLRPVALLEEELGRERAAECIASAIRRHRRAAQRRRRAEGRAALGLERVLEADVWSRAPKPDAARVQPTFKGVVAEALKMAGDTLRRFRRAYAEALASLREGKRDVEFPVGTFYLHRRFGLHVVDAPRAGSSEEPRLSRNREPSFGGGHALPTRFDVRVQRPSPSAGCADAIAHASPSAA